MYTQYYDSRYDPAAPVIDVTINGPESTGKGQTLTALIDSGADATLIPLEMLKSIGAEFVTTRRMRGVLGKTYEVDVFVITVEVGRHRLDGINAIAIESGAEEPIIGRDVLNRLIVTLNGLGEVVEIQDP